MGCTSSNSFGEEQPKPQRKAKKEEVKIEEGKKEEKEEKAKSDEKPNYLYCYSEEEIGIIQNLLKEKTFQKDQIIFNKVSINIDKDFSSYKEYLTIQTEKIKGQKYSGKYSFTSSVVLVQKKVLSTVKINNNSIETIKNKPTTDYQKIEIEYNLSENDNSIITLEINSLIETKINSNLLSINFSHSGSFFKLNIKTSEDFCYSNISRKTENIFKKISDQEIVLSGNNREHYLNITFKYKEGKFKLSKNMKYFYYCNEDEIRDMETALNSVKLKDFDVNIFAIKDIYNIKNEKVTAKTYMTFIYPNNQHTTICANFFFKVKPGNNLEYISSKQNNEKEIKAKLETWNAFNMRFILEDELFCTIELDYSFSLRNVGGRNLSLEVDHNEMLLDKGFYECLIHYEMDNLKEIKQLSEIDYDKNDPIYKYKKKCFKNRFSNVMLAFICN